MVGLARSMYFSGFAGVVQLGKQPMAWNRNRRGAGGRDDGIYRIDRDYRPENERMRELFGGFLDKVESDWLASELGTPKSPAGRIAEGHELRCSRSGRMRQHLTY